MAHYEMDYPDYPSIAINAERSERAAFIRRTYAHLAGAVLAFAGLLTAVFTLIPEASLNQFMVTALGGRAGILVLFVAFIAAGYLAQWWAHSSTSLAMQYAGLGLYVVIEAVIFVPILWIIQTRTGAVGDSAVTHPVRLAAAMNARYVFHRRYLGTGELRRVSQDGR